MYIYGRTGLSVNVDNIGEEFLINQNVVDLIFGLMVRWSLHKWLYGYLFMGKKYFRPPYHGKLHVRYGMYPIWTDNQSTHWNSSYRGVHVADGNFWRIEISSYRTPASIERRTVLSHLRVFRTVHDDDTLVEEMALDLQLAYPPRLLVDFCNSARFFHKRKNSYPNQRKFES